MGGRGAGETGSKGAEVQGSTPAPALLRTSAPHLPIYFSGMVPITVRLYATLRKYAPPGLEMGQSFTVSLSEGSYLRDLLAALHIPAGETKQVFVKSRRQEEDYLLQNGDDAAIFPPIAGG